VTVPILTFFNNKGGVGKTSLVYHLAWMIAELGGRVVAVDLDPQANLTTAFLPEEALEALWTNNLSPERALTIHRCVSPLTEVGDLRAPETIDIDQRSNPRLHLIPGDLALAGFEDFLSQEWPNSLGSANLYRPFRILSAFWQVAQLAARTHQADVILADVGPNLGAINRSALIASDHVIIPLAADIFSLQGLSNLGPTLRRWRADWTKRLDNWSAPSFELPRGAMQPVGYILLQHAERLKRPVKAYAKWAERIPGEYRGSVLQTLEAAPLLEHDPLCLARIKNYRSLIPMAQDVAKPIFKLTPADGAIGSHSYAVANARKDFQALAEAILMKIGVSLPSSLSHPE
jgi:chromosome partitioning protein